MRSYYIHSGSEPIGPFTIEELKNQSIQADSPVWYEGLPAWTTARNVEELSILFTSSKVVNSESINVKTQKSKTNSNTFLFVGGGLFLLIILFFLFLKFGTGSSSNAGNSQYESSNTSELPASSNSSSEGTSSPNEQSNPDNHSEDVVRAANIELLEMEQKNLRNNWSSYIRIQGSDYNYREMGGIFDLYLTVYNRTNYNLDAGRVHIDIIKANGDIFTTEYLDFSNLGPQNSVTLKVPDCERGTSVGAPAFDGIFSKDFNFCYEASRPYNPSDESDYNKCTN